MIELGKQVIETIREAARKLRGCKRRAFEAEVTTEYLEGKAREAEKVFGWSRETVKQGMEEVRSGIICVERFGERGNQRSEERKPKMAEDIKTLADPESQADPKFQTVFQYTRMTAKRMREALIKEKGWKSEELPCENTIGAIMNRLGYRMRRVQKTKPVKRLPETDAIFENVARENQASDERADSLRISMDVKNKVKVGDFSRNGEIRAAEAPQAWDHDLNPEAQLVPLGILNLHTHSVDLFFGTSRSTSDFIVDGLQCWWDAHRSLYPQIRHLAIDLDNGPEQASNRTQFMQRLVQFADHNQLEICLIYYPPYHSKYNPVERCFGVLEQHWNGALLNSTDSVLAWAHSMTWNGQQPIVTLWDKVYQTGISIAKKAFKFVEQRLQRLPDLPKYSVRIFPLTC